MTKLEALKELLEKVDAGEEYLERDIQDVWGGYRSSFQSRDALKAYNGSLDAAEALFKAVLPEWDWCGGSDGFSVYSPIDNEPVDGDHNIPARAWLIAILKALISTEERG